MLVPVPPTPVFISKALVDGDVVVVLEQFNENSEQGDGLAADRSAGRKVLVYRMSSTNTTALTDLLQVSSDLGKGGPEHVVEKASHPHSLRTPARVHPSKVANCGTKCDVCVYLCGTGRLPQP